MSTVPLMARLQGAGERVDRMSLRERVLVFVVGVALVYVAWQTLLMDPITARGKASEQRVEAARTRLAQMNTATANGSPRLQALERRRALQQQLASLNEQLRDAAGGFVAPDRMADLLRDVLEKQRGLRLVSLRNLPVENLAALALPEATAAAATGPTPGAVVDSAPASGASNATEPDAAAGPFVHPVEVVVEGDFASIVAYLRALEALQWQVQWRRLDLAAGDYPNNRVRIEIGTLGLTRDWMTV